MSLQAGKYVNLIKRHFPEGEWITALAVMQQESSGNPHSANMVDFHGDPNLNIPREKNRLIDDLTNYRQGSFGLMQVFAPAVGGAYDYIINPLLGDSPAPKDRRELLYVPEINMALARQIFNEGGWSRWGAYTDGNYLQYLDAAADLIGRTPGMIIPIKTPEPTTEYKDVQAPTQSIEVKTPTLTTKPQPTPQESTPNDMTQLEHKHNVLNQAIPLANEVSTYAGGETMSWLKGKYGKLLDTGQRWAKVGGLGATVAAFINSKAEVLAKNHIQWGDTIIQGSHLLYLGLIILVGLAAKWFYSRVKSGRATAVERQISHFFAWKQRGAKLNKLGQFYKK